MKFPFVTRFPADATAVTDALAAHRETSMLTLVFGEMREMLAVKNDAEKEPLLAALNLVGWNPVSPAQHQWRSAAEPLAVRRDAAEVGPLHRRHEPPVNRRTVHLQCKCSIVTPALGKD
jgi:hypothetical protein